MRRRRYVLIRGVCEWRNGIRSVCQFTYGAYMIGADMTRRTRSEMIVETRGKLLAAGRKTFATLGYADASMDDFTSEAGLTRGALYHHFGDKKGLFEAVVAEIDAEMARRLKERAARAANRWEGFIEEGIGYIEMALEPEIQRIMLRDGPA